MDTKLSPAELIDRLPDVLDRVQAGERFTIERGSRVVAVLASPTPPNGITGRELEERIGDLMMPGDGFADDVEAFQAAQRPAVMPEWPD